MTGKPKYKTILGIETSCDETAAAVVQLNDNKVTLLSNIISSSLSLQSKYGGIIPEQAAREQLKAMIPVIQEAIEQAKLKIGDIDAIAVTEGPGLIGSLLVGVETAKTLSLIYKKPLIRVNHLLAHFYGNWVETTSSWESGSATPVPHHRARSEYENGQWESSSVSFAQTSPSFPTLGLLVSGGHTYLILMHDHGKYQYLGGTRDDAAGECFDKSARILGLPYPGGPQISKLAQSGNPKAYPLPRPMIDSDDFNFSFSGLKTAVLYLVKNLTRDDHNSLTDQQLKDLAASIQEAITEVLVEKLIKASKKYRIGQIMVAGGVAANTRLKEFLNQRLNQEIPNFKLFLPPPNLCTDNGAIIAIRALLNPEVTSVSKLQANPSLSL